VTGFSPAFARWRTGIAVTVAAGVSAAVNVPSAVESSFWQDEVGSARVITTPGLFSMLHRVVDTENHPPGFYFLAWLLDRAGTPVVWDRTLSVVAAMALSGMVVAYARGLMPLSAAFLAGLLTALGWQFWRHGWELRPYSVFALACLFFVFALERAADHSSRGRLALLALAVAAGSMLHYYFLLTLAAGVIWIGLGDRRRGRLLSAVAIGLVPLIVWLPALHQQLVRGGYRTGGFSARSALDTYGALFARGDVSLVLALVMLGLVLFGSARLWRASEQGRLCALCAVLPVAAASLAWLLGLDIYITKNLIGAAPFAAVAIAKAFTALPRPMAIAATAAAAAITIVGWTRTNGPIVPDYDRVASALVREGWREQDPILVFGPPYQLLHPLDWYLPGSRLELASLSKRPCARVFVIGVGGRGRALTAGQSQRRVRHIVIARVPYRRDLANDVRRRSGRVLATRAASCARVA
jgi:hypothetical protein